MYSLNKIIILIFLILIIKDSLGVFFAGRSGSTCFSANDDSKSFYTKQMETHEKIKELAKFVNCETIIGNLILDNINVTNGEKLNFFNSVKKITGYLAIMNCNLPYVPFSNLEIISGHNLIEVHGQAQHALFITELENTSFVGFDSLKEISQGSVLFQSSHHNVTGYSNTIHWNDILMNGSAAVEPKNNEILDPDNYLCHPQCKHPGRCWGPFLQNCQELNMEVCGQRCPGSRCFFPENSNYPVCCHKECAGGCSGMTNGDCFGCANFNATGQCVTSCPAPLIYDYTQFKMVDNPDVLYGLGNECLESCPSPFMVDSGNCVKQCSGNLVIEEHTNKCVPCPVEGCPKRCPGFSSTGDLEIGRCTDKKGKKCLKPFRAKYANCTIIEGNIDIDDKFQAKFGDKAAAALDILSTVEEITGYLSIQTTNMFIDFSFLRNLKKIRGLYLKPTYTCEPSEDNSKQCVSVTLKSALTIEASKDITLTQLRLNALELVEQGMIIISAGQGRLCYLPEKEALAKIMQKPDLNTQTDIIITYNKTYCNTHDRMCHDTCIGGCWGVGPSNCVQCTSLSFEGHCVSSCAAAMVGRDFSTYVDATNGTCKRCHPECAPGSSCTGPEDNQCTKCRNFSDGPYCVPVCHNVKYANETGTCLECNKKCMVEKGCSGPSRVIGPGGCNFCHVVKLMKESNTGSNDEKVWGQCEMECAADQYPDNYKPYPDLPTHDLGREERVKVCTQCDEFCSSCISSGTSIHVCTCKYAQDGDVCLGQCPAGKWRSLVDKTCRQCDGPCPNNCIGSEEVPFNALRRAHFANCNLVEGSIIINADSWTGPDAITAADLEAFDEVVNITGRLVIVDSPDPTFTNLDMFRRLEVVKGNHTANKRATDGYAIEISNNKALETAELVSLKEVGGPVKLAGENLCYVDRVDWSAKLAGQQVTVEVSSDKCADKPCGEQCNQADGCLGPSNDACISCENKHFEGSCLATCQGASYDPYDASKECKPCHENCNTCTGGGNQDCTDCKYVYDRSACVRQCTKKHMFVKEKHCMDCNPACTQGCTGAGDFEGVGGCNTCKIYDNTVSSQHTQMCAYKCPERSYKTTTQEEPNGEFKNICEPCHPQCAECDYKSSSNCARCMNVKQDDKCQESCDLGYYPSSSKMCMPCHKDCATCSGPGNSSCTACNNYELPTPEIRETRTCVSQCPEKYAAQKNSKVGDKRRKVCAESCEDSGVRRDEDFCQFIEGRGAPTSAPREHTVAVTIAVGVAIVIIFIVVGIVCWKRVKQGRTKRMNMIKYAQRMHDNINPIYEPVVQDDTAYYPMNDGELLIVTENSLEIGDVLGSGAFGKVYEGRWHPPETTNDSGLGLRVAIKILKDSGDPESAREFFDEALVMGKLDHKHLVRVLGLCASKMMLVTQLMPLGSLLDYVRKYKSSVTAHHLLTYGHQIAKGMAYLEENNVVHRDLAARNVLVQTPTFVKITDFGLAKVLSSKTQMFTSEGGKLPIKWLALESLKFRHFTSRSDTWSYGVTIWEVLEFGQLPWRTKPPNELIRSLETGERLPKPKTCTMEVYVLMLQCWVLKQTARPNFQDLTSKMEEFLKEPNRFVHTPNNTSSNNHASTEGSFLSPHPSITSEYRDSGIVDVDRNYENDDRAMAMQRALYDATSSLKHHNNQTAQAAFGD